MGCKCGQKNRRKSNTQVVVNRNTSTNSTPSNNNQIVALSLNGTEKSPSALTKERQLIERKRRLEVSRRILGK